MEKDPELTQHALRYLVEKPNGDVVWMTLDEIQHLPDGHTVVDSPKPDAVVAHPITASMVTVVDLLVGTPKAQTS